MSVQEWSAQVEPALIEHRLVKPRLGVDVVAWLLRRPRCRPGHLAHAQVFERYHRPVLADHGLVQVFPADVADLLDELGTFGFCVVPVVADPAFATHRPLITGQRRSLLFEHQFAHPPDQVTEPDLT